MGDLYGWASKILRVDLSTGRVEAQDTAPYAEGYIGGRGFAARFAWEELGPGVGPFDADNPLMAFTGPLAGTTAPCSGRTVVAAVSPQAHPIEWFTRSNLGGHWGPALKYAGWDGIVITGRAERPAYLWIEDDRVELRDAGELWGSGTYATQQRLAAEHGRGISCLAIGQAGEHLSRLAIINSETESAAGQGGFGAVMGAKGLKAIAVRGTGGVRIARPDEFLRVCQAIAQELHAPCGVPQPGGLDPEQVARYGARCDACTQGCAVRCVYSHYYRKVPSRLHPGEMLAGQMHCVSNLFPGMDDALYDWKIGFEAGFELSKLANDYGINHWDLLIGVVPWLRTCQAAGLVADLDGLPLDFDSPAFWAELLRRIAYREGEMGDALSQGGRRAPALLGFGQEIMDAFYTGWGFSAHWGGHTNHANSIFFPYWLVSALQWAMDTRDPMGGAHGYAQNIMMWSPSVAGDAGLSWEELTRVAARVYGTEQAAHPLSGYDAKAIPAVWHGHRGVIKDSAPVDDQMFPRIYSKRTADHFARSGDMEGPAFEAHMLAAATGVDWDADSLDHAAERVFNLERALQVRNYGRTRAMDESVIPFFERPEYMVNPFIGHRMSLDRTEFLRLMDEYYALRDWDPETGRPTRAKLEMLGLRDVADDLERRGLLP
jgi:aldehyde:ferredoxin oxidoreductase